MLQLQLRCRYSISSVRQPWQEFEGLCLQFCSALAAQAATKIPAAPHLLGAGSLMKFCMSKFTFAQLNFLERQMICWHLHVDWTLAPPADSNYFQSQFCSAQKLKPVLTRMQAWVCRAIGGSAPDQFQPTANAPQTMHKKLSNSKMHARMHVCRCCAILFRPTQMW